MDNYRNADDTKCPKMLGYFIGQIMKASKGQANPQKVNDVLLKQPDRFPFEFRAEGLSFDGRHTHSPLGLLSPLKSVRQTGVGLHYQTRDKKMRMKNRLRIPVFIITCSLFLACQVSYARPAVGEYCGKVSRLNTMSQGGGSPYFMAIGASGDVIEASITRADRNTSVKSYDSGIAPLNNESAEFLKSLKLNEEVCVSGTNVRTEVNFTVIFFYEGRKVESLISKPQTNLSVTAPPVPIVQKNENQPPISSAATINLNPIKGENTAPSIRTDGQCSCVGATKTVNTIKCLDPITGQAISKSQNCFTKKILGSNQGCGTFCDSAFNVCRGVTQEFCSDL